ncbi:MAG: hypothetical protein B0D92_04385 [Spirochaeta sp. LUC14_002_19_P3]|nr:MAG: hypothetical protein B0D92_04385 [Spirochaeta sp. LUC14_002_19_P3]
MGDALGIGGAAACRRSAACRGLKPRKARPPRKRRKRPKAVLRALELSCVFRYTVAMKCFLFSSAGKKLFLLVVLAVCCGFSGVASDVFSRDSLSVWGNTNVRLGSSKRSVTAQITLENVIDEALNNIEITFEEGLKDIQVTVEPSRIKRLLPEQQATVDFTVLALRRPKTKELSIDFELYAAADGGVRNIIYCNAILEPAVGSWIIAVVALSVCLTAVFVLIYVRQSRRVV